MPPARKTAPKPPKTAAKRGKREPKPKPISQNPGVALALLGRARRRGR